MDEKEESRQAALRLFIVSQNSLLLAKIRTIMNTAGTPESKLREISFNFREAELELKEFLGAIK